MGQPLHCAKCSKKNCKTLLPKHHQQRIASFPSWKPCHQLPSAGPQWSEPTPGSGLRGHSHMTAGNSLFSARITAQRAKTVVYWLCSNKLTVEPSSFFSIVQIVLFNLVNSTTS